ncbi:GAF domain-containing protein [Desmospora activa]|uniref:GAF domain-containing protein n=1 Tax=Desmospora activa DSM 45169 TaxID=1121389 RepID=A0A2T4Z852_9BACL|nr:GAF domain-containing protein [Desmospora activa]PTM58045.1 hypothetical protein C8J48_0617 [Desmospora activa DSM 45169]
MNAEVLDRLFKKFPWFPYVFACMAILGFGWWLLTQPVWENLTPSVLIIGSILTLFVIGLCWWGYRKTSKSINQINDFSQSEKENLRSAEALDIMSTIGSTTAKLLYESYSSYKFGHAINHICWLIRVFMTNPKSTDPRVVIFIPNGAETKLNPCGWAGHSTDLLQYNPKITEKNSAGFTYITGEDNYEPDVTARGARFESNPESENHFYSLLTTPIRCGKEVIGVISITGNERHSYDESEYIPYMKAFANALSSLVYYHLKSQEGKRDGPSEEAVSSTTGKTV